MYCSSCGTHNDDNNFRCVQCGNIIQQGAGGQPAGYGAYGGVQEHVPNYLVQSILVTLFCCWPFGIPAIVFAAQVNAKLGQGDVEGAMESSRKAKFWASMSFGIGLVVGIIYILAIVAGGLSV